MSRDPRPTVAVGRADHDGLADPDDASVAEPPSPRLVAAGLAVGVTAVSSAAILIRLAMGEDGGIVSAADSRASALAIAFWRTALGAAALAPFAVRAQRRRRPLAPGRRRQLALSGAVLALHFSLWLASLTLTTVASSVTLVTASPIFVALGAWWLLSESTERRTWVGMAITMAGAVTIAFADATGIALGPRALLGDALAFGGALAVAGYLLIGRQTRADVAASTYSAVVFGWAAAFLLILCLVLGVPLAGYAPATWLAILAIVVGPQLLGHSVFNTLLSYVPATIVSIVVLAEPVGATILAWLVLGELPAALFFAGAPLVLLGVFVATTRPRRPATEVIPAVPTR